MEIHPERAGEKKNRACGAIRDARFILSGSILVVGLLLLGRELFVHLLLLLVVLADFLQLVHAFGLDRPATRGYEVGGDSVPEGRFVIDPGDLASRP